MPSADRYNNMSSKSGKKLSGISKITSKPSTKSASKPSGVSARAAIGKNDSKVVNAAGSKLLKFVEDSKKTKPSVPEKSKPATATSTTTASSKTNSTTTTIKSTPEVPSTKAAGNSGASSAGNGSSSSTGAPIKIATSNLFIENEPELTIDEIENLSIQEIGGIELITISKNYLISEQEINYQPIKNIADTSLQYNPLNILALQDIDSEYFNKFPINLDKYIPNVGNGTGGAYVYINTNNEVVVESVNLQPGQFIEIQFLSFGSTISGTIYT